MKKIYFIAIMAIAAIIAIGYLIASNSGKNESADSGGGKSQAAPLGKAPGFHLSDYSGKTVNLADFSGEPVVINSWASWCPFCREELPAFSAAQKEFADKVVIIAIDRQESLATARGYTNSQGTTGSLIFLLDPADSFYQSIGGFSMPETIFVDKNGNITDHKRGPMDINEMRQKISKIL